jgi:hypothetical protein
MTTRPTLSSRLRYAALLALALFGASAWPACAHRSAQASQAAPGAISIPSLTHGQMRVVGDHLGAIRSLADAQFPTDPTFRRLQGFVNLQSFVCFRGAVPGSLTDEDSPFNECAHAYLAAARLLLQHLQTMPGTNREAVNSLVQRMDAQMYENGASFVMCRYSEEPFSTGEVIPPHWALLPFHLPSLATFATPVLLAGTAAAFAWRRRSKAPPRRFGSHAG